MSLDFAYSHAARIQRQNLVIEPRPAGLMLRDQLRLKRTLAIARNLNRQFPKLALEGLLALAIAGIAGLVLHRLVLAVTQMLGHLRLQGAFDDALGQLL